MDSKQIPLERAIGQVWPLKGTAPRRFWYGGVSSGGHPDIGVIRGLWRWRLSGKVGASLCAGDHPARIAAADGVARGLQCGGPWR